MRRPGPAAAEEEPEDPGPERIYVLTGGRGGPNAHTRLDLVTLVVAIGRGGGVWTPGRRLFPEHDAILNACRRPVSVVELSAYMRLPFSATAVLVEDLLQAGLVRTRAATLPSIPDPALLEEVLRGLQRL